MIDWSWSVAWLVCWSVQLLRFWSAWWRVGLGHAVAGEACVARRCCFHGRSRDCFSRFRHSLMTSSTMSRWIKPLKTPIAIWSVNRPDTGEEISAPFATRQTISMPDVFSWSLDTRHAVLFLARSHTTGSPAQVSNLTALQRTTTRRVIHGFDQL